MAGSLTHIKIVLYTLTAATTFLCIAFYIVEQQNRQRRVGYQTLISMKDIMRNIITVKEQGEITEEEFDKEFDNSFVQKEEELEAKENLTYVEIPSITIPNNTASVINLDRQSWKRHVLLWSYFRSGSTFMGEVLSSRRDSVLFNEPFRLDLRKYGVNRKEDALNKIFRCDMPTLRKIFRSHYPSRKFLFPKTGRSKKSCRRSRTVVIKANRLEAPHFSSKWLQEQHDVKIVHLIRDPRAIISSRRSRKKIRGKQRDPAYVCPRMMADLKMLNKTVPKERYYRIKLEEFMEDPIYNTHALYKFIRVPINYAVLGYIKHHTSNDPGNESGDTFHKHRGGKDMSTFRDYSKMHEKWAKRLSGWDVWHIEKHCKGLMDLMGYPRYRART